MYSILLDYKILRYLRTISTEYRVSEELRGWEWYREPIRPPTEIIRLGVSDIANRYCDTMRDLYLKYVMNINVRPNFSMIWGKAIHEVYRTILETSRKILIESSIITGSEFLEKIYEDDMINIIVENILKSVNVTEEYTDQISKIRKACINFAKFLVIQIASRIDTELAKGRNDSNNIVGKVLPFFTEYKIDGSLIGLKDCLKVDMMYHNIIIELKCGKIEHFHKLALAGYALAIESDLEIPIDYALLVYVNFNGKMIPRIRTIPIIVDDSLRREFLELRDNAMELILHERDPGISQSCPQDCPYRNYCRGV